MGKEERDDLLRGSKGPEMVTVSGNSVQIAEATIRVKDWRKDYEESAWFGPAYQQMTGEKYLESSFVAELPSSLDYAWGGSRLWKKNPKTELDVICVPEGKVQEVIETAHDQGGHWGFESTFLKVRRRYYWPHQGDDVKAYIRGCPECAKQNPWTQKPPIHPILTVPPFQIVGMDFIGPLQMTSRNHAYILHLVDYFF